MNPRLLLLLLLAASVPDAAAAPSLSYRSLELEAAGEYQAGDQDVGPGYVRLIGTAEFSLTEQLSAKAIVAPCAGRYSDEPEGVTQCSRRRLVEQLTLDGIGDNYDFTVGHQVITVGNTEGFVLLDRFNGRDYCRFARLDTDNKLPNGIMRGRAFLGSTTLSLIYAPLSAESEIPDPSGYCADLYNDPGRFDGLGDPGNDDLSDWASGVEIAFNQDRWNGALNLISTREDLFVLKTVPAAEKTRPRTLWLGGTAAATLGGVVVRGELAYAPERDFTIAPESALGLVMRGVPTDGVEARWNLLASVGLEIRKGDWFWALQYFNDQVESGARLTRDSRLQMLSLRLRVTFANDRIAFSGFSILDPDERDLGLNAVVSYELDEKTTIELGGTLYSDYGGETGYFGSYAGRESLYTKINYAF